MGVGVGDWRSCLYYVRLVLDGRLEYNVQSARNSGSVAVVDFRPMLRQAGVNTMTVRSDNAATVCNLQRQGAGLALLKLTRAIFRILTTLDIRLHVAHIPGKENVLVDALSRMEVTGDYVLDQGVFQQAIQLLGVMPTVDLFAHKYNNKLPRFVAMDGPLAGGAVRTDAFPFTWRGELVYAFPPIQLVGRVLQRIQEKNLCAVVVVPKWPSHWWWRVFRACRFARSSWECRSRCCIRA
jgi:hypothetical protein